jgi:hypothetical protein
MIAEKVGNEAYGNGSESGGKSEMQNFERMLRRLVMDHHEMRL